MSVWSLWLVYLAKLVIGGNGESPPNSCDYMSAGGAYYDFSNLRGKLFSIEDLHGTFTYKFSLCANVDLVSFPACLKSAPGAPSLDLIPPEQGPAFQLSTDKDSGVVLGCFRLGTLGKSSWSLIDPDDEEKGVELTYGGGERCSGTREREIRFHFICADGFPKDSPPMFAFETNEYCHYNVTWPTILACPVYHNAYAWTKFGIKAVLVAILLYFVLGCCYYHFQQKKEWGWESLPNANVWATCMDALADKLTCLSCLRRTGEQGEGEEGASKTSDEDDFDRRFPIPAKPAPTIAAPGGAKTKK